MPATFLDEETAAKPTGKGATFLDETKPEAVAQAAPTTPSVGQIAKTAGEAALEVGKEFVTGLVPRRDLSTLTEVLFPPLIPAIEAQKQVQGISQTVKRVQEAEKTPAFSKERFEAGFSTVAQMGMAALAMRGLRPGLTESLAPVLGEEVKPLPQQPISTPITDRAVAERPIPEPVRPAGALEPERMVREAGATQERQIQEGIQPERPRDDTLGTPTETGGGGGLRPAAQVQPQEAVAVPPEQPKGTVRLYHGGSADQAGRDFTTSLSYAQGYADKAAGGGKVWYVDVPEGSLKTHDEYGQPMSRVVVPNEVADQAKPLVPEGAGAAPTEAAMPPAPAATGVPATEVPFVEGSPQIAGEVPFEQAIASKRMAVVGTQEPITVKPLTALKTVYQAAEKAGEAGYKRGSTEARAEGKAAIAQIKGELNVADKWMAGDQEQVRQNMVEFVNKTLPPAERGRFIGAITRALRRPALQGGDPAVMYKNAFRVFRAIEGRAEEVYRGGLIGDIKDSLSKSVDAPGIDVRYRRGIKDLLNRISLTKPSAETISRLKSLQDYVERERAAGREPNVPKEELDQLSLLTKLPLKDMPTNALEQLRDNIDNFVGLGRLKAKLMERAWERSRERAVKELTQAPANPIESRPLYQAQPTEQLSLGQRFVNKVRATINNRLKFEQAIAPMDEIYDHLDGATGRYDGWTSRNVKGKLDLAFNETQAELQPIKNQGREIIKRNALSKADLETIGVKGVVNMIGRERLEAMGVRPDILDRIESTSLTKGQQEYYDFTRSNYDRIGQRTQDIAHQLYQQDIGIVPDYVPLMRDWAMHAEREAPAPLADPVAGEVPFDETATMRQLQRDVSPKILSRTEQGFLKERIEGAKTAVKINAQEVFERHMNDALHFVHAQPVLKMLGEIVRKPEFEAKYGKFGQQVVLDNLDTIANQGYVNHLQRIRWVDWVRNSTSKGAVGFRIASNIVHTSQLPLAAYHAGGANWWNKGLQLALTEKGQAFLRANAAETYVRSGGEPAQAEVEAYSKFGRAGFFIARNIDKLNSQATFLGRYAKEMEKAGVSVDDVLDSPVNPELQALALRRMHRAVASPQAKDIPQMTSRGKGVGGNVSVARAINQFRNIFLDNWSNVRHDMLRVGQQDGERIIEALRQGEISQGAKDVGDAASHRLAVAAAVTMGVAMETGIKLYTKQAIQAGMSKATGVEPPEKKQDEGETYASAFEHHLVNRIPFAGQITTMILYGETGVPVIDAIVSPFRETGVALTSKKSETTAKHIVKAISAAGTVAGVPGTSQVLEAAEPKASQALAKAIPDRSKIKVKSEHYATRGRTERKRSR